MVRDTLIAWRYLSLKVLTGCVWHASWSPFKLGAACGVVFVRLEVPTQLIIVAQPCQLGRSPGVHLMDACKVTSLETGREADLSIMIKGGSDVPLVAADPRIILRAVNAEAAPVPPSQHPT